MTFPRHLRLLILAFLAARAKSDAAQTWGNSSVVRIDVGPSGLRSDQPVTEPRPGCGLVKTGPGTLAVTSDLKLTGVVTVQQGILDLSAAKPDAALRFNLAEGAGLKLPQGRVVSCNALFLADEKQAPGKWGGKGSVAAKQADFETPALSGGMLVVKDTGPSARERWKRMKYGLFVHYVNDGNGHTTLNMDGSPNAGADYLAENFDAAGFADDVASMGVEYLIFTAWHSNFHPLFNSAAVERVPPNERPRIKTPKTDMLGNMVAAVRAKGVRVLFYTHPGQQLFWGEDWNRFMEEIYGEMVDRYDIDGFYVDENDPGGNSDRNIDFHRIERAVRWRKPDAVMIQNFYGNLYAFDSAIGESGPASPNFSPNVAWTMANPYAQVISKTWSAQVPESAHAHARRHPQSGGHLPRHRGRRRLLRGRRRLGLGGRSVPRQRHVDQPGHRPNQVRRPLGGGRARSHAKSRCLPRTHRGVDQRHLPEHFLAAARLHRPTPMGRGHPLDRRQNRIHPCAQSPAGSLLTLPPPDDGKSFAKARLLPCGKPVKLDQSPAGLRLTLPDGESWNPLDTVIAMDVTGKGGFSSRIFRADDPSVIFGTREVFNDNVTQPGGAGWIEYHGNWSGQQRDGGEYQSDIHYTAADGDAFTIHFNGTGVMMVGNGLGEIDFSLDGKP